MGVIIKKLTKVNFENSKLKYLEIEYNKGPIIHLQNDIMRIEMRPEEFTHFASQIIISANKLIESKKIDE